MVTEWANTEPGGQIARPRIDPTRHRLATMLWKWQHANQPPCVPVCCLSSSSRSTRENVGQVQHCAYMPLYTIKKVGHDSVGFAWFINHRQMVRSFQDDEVGSENVLLRLGSVASLTRPTHHNKKGAESPSTHTKDQQCDIASCFIATNITLTFAF